MNRDRRKVIANIFADAAKYVLTAGIIGSLLAEKSSFLVGTLLVLLFSILTGIAYFVTPRDKEE